MICLYDRNTKVVRVLVLKICQFSLKLSNSCVVVSLILYSTQRKHFRFMCVTIPKIRLYICLTFDDTIRLEYFIIVLGPPKVP